MWFQICKLYTEIILKMRVIGIIPVRYDSKRFPGKALAVLQDKPLLQHVWENARGSSILEELVIATDDKRIYDAAIGFGASVVITPKQYYSGTDRVAHAVSSLDCEIVVNIQVDQPFLIPQIIDEVVDRLLGQPELLVTTPIYPLVNPGDVLNPNIVKVVVDKEGYALYFSRSPLPYIKNRIEDFQVFNKHIGIYAYRKDFLDRFSRFSPGPLEISEGLEQLRVLENGYRIMTVKTIYDSPGVDTEEDIELLQGKWIKKP